MVETALVFLPMMAIFFGVIDFSLAVWVQSTLTSSTREGTRFAITYSSGYNGTSCATSQATCISQVVQDNAYGLLSGTKSNYITVNYYTANDLTNPAESCNNGTCTANPNGVSTASMPQTLTNGTVVNYVNQPGNVVEVAISGYPWNWLVPIKGFSPGTGLQLGGESMDVLGGLAVGVSTPPNP
jgi:Flp pilus assembly protein TadG